MRTAVEARKRGSPKRYFIEAVGKAIEVMWAFHGKPEGLTIDEVVAATRIAKSSAYRILCTLVHAEMLAIDPDQGRYLISSRFFQLATSVEPDLRRVAEPHMRRLRAELNETINLGKLAGSEVIFVSRFASQHPFRVEVSEGSRGALHATALGKIIAAHLPHERLEQILTAKKMERLTPNTIVSPRRFWNELVKIRDAGYAVDNEEAIEGGRCMAAPIFDARGEVVAALSVSGPVTRITESRLNTIADQLKQTCRAISSAMGYTSVTEGAAHPPHLR